VAQEGHAGVSERGLTQDFDVHTLFVFDPIPESPRVRNVVARTRRWFVIAFVESWLAVWLYRMKMALRRRRVPLLPGACDLVSRTLFKVQIGNDVEIGRGLMITHGCVVIDGRVKIGRHCQINPWVTIGLSNSKKLGFNLEGPTIGDHVHIGTGAKLIGPVKVGDHARIGANAVVVHDVPANATVVGMPARVVGSPVGAPTNGATPSISDAVSRMREAINEYRLHRCSLQSLVDVLNEGFAAPRGALPAVEAEVQEDLIFLDAVAATGGEETKQVRQAVDAVEAALLRSAGVR
jgi:serine O-acetyltransferase